MLGVVDGDMTWKGSEVLSSPVLRYSINSRNVDADNWLETDREGPMLETNTPLHLYFTVHISVHCFLHWRWMLLLDELTSAGLLRISIIRDRGGILHFHTADFTCSLIYGAGSQRDFFSCSTFVFPRNTFFCSLTVCLKFYQVSQMPCKCTAGVQEQRSLNTTHIQSLHVVSVTPLIKQSTAMATVITTATVCLNQPGQRSVSQLH